ncbi:MAG: hypothetical protein JKY19_02550, partial [Alcanivoracaceae bacterium]|nr:hypothetical protein [Alcanivoracaceae bacterium]
IEGWEKAIMPLSTCDYEYGEGRHLYIMEGDSSIQITDKILSDLNNIDLINKRD